MNATEEWLRYIENRTLKQRFNINDEEESDEKEDEKTKDSECI